MLSVSPSSIWKLSVVLAVISLVSLPIELVEVERHTLSRRAAIGTVANDVRCGDNWGTASVPVPAGQVSCRSYNGKNKGLPYFCTMNKCHYGSKKDKIPPAGYSLSDWRFKDCTRYPNQGETGKPTVVKSMSPIQIWAHNTKAYLVATGWDDPLNKITRTYKCSWVNFSDANNQRPTCQECTLQAYEDLPEPIITP
ncbi:hypothetical protein PTTG_11722 [Puccinia triticina 1-1 BBBD Race 1]|uniref:Secreted protein n=2 Tax=Puccinia triticina TaxID=208348 RepID=A0A180H4B6_PUCT1|nr:uncharacterized protein PtA15_2A461 [Puccinia triticina]OAV99651.1 hypothetical protein PTTG_11722 [Puccinia triticina 1-1 BBBD Race 1]WAQ82146.1 hypothetical protein PtA15_2A461 [Puccinia triticina]WAR53004.1 hypothetical protein PtB15_2B432 [Puccinia triticina]